jgi:hypothetical protein
MNTTTIWSFLQTLAQLKILTDYIYGQDVKATVEKWLKGKRPRENR